MKRLLILVMALFVVTGCGAYTQSIQVNDKSYLLLIGDPDDNIVTIDNGQSIELGKETISFYLNGRTATKIEISPGTHTIMITKDGELTVNRKFYVSAGNSFEVQL